MLLGMASKALIVTEPIFLPDPFVSGRHYVSAPVEEMAETIRAYLADEAERRRITERAYSFVSEDLTAERSLATILDLASRQLAVKENDEGK